MISPFTILIDTREQLPYAFAGIFTDKSRKGETELIAPQTEFATLRTGDYSIAGVHDSIAIERKSKEDLYHTLGQGRERFEREILRLHRREFAFVVVEAEWSEILHDPPKHSALNPKTIHRTVMSWQYKYRNVKWWFLPNRRLAEITTYRLLERYHKTYMVEGET